MNKNEKFKLKINRNSSFFLILIINKVYSDSILEIFSSTRYLSVVPENPFDVWICYLSYLFITA